MKCNVEFGKKGPGRTKWVVPLDVVARKCQTGMDICPLDNSNKRKADHIHIPLDLRVGDALNNVEYITKLVHKYVPYGACSQTWQYDGSTCVSCNQGDCN